MSCVTPLGAVARGLAAGVIGTAVMTAWQEVSMRLESSGEGHAGDGGSGPAVAEQDPWERASAPAKVARKFLEGVFDERVPPEKIGLLTNVMHWGYGTGWGAIYGLIQGTRPGPALRRGLLFGTAVWAMSYVTLVPMGLYQPPWKYSPNEVALDISYHLAYGAGVGAGYAAVDR
jgi:uncharacterized membrane protein YagU involved in acid resistance